MKKKIRINCCWREMRAIEGIGELYILIDRDTGDYKGKLLCTWEEAITEKGDYHRIPHVSLVMKGKFADYDVVKRRDIYPISAKNIAIMRILRRHESVFFTGYKVFGYDQDKWYIYYPEMWCEALENAGYKVINLFHD